MFCKELAACLLLGTIQSDVSYPEGLKMALGAGILDGPLSPIDSSLPVNICLPSPALCAFICRDEASSDQRQGVFGGGSLPFKSPLPLEAGQAPTYLAFCGYQKYFLLPV